MKEQPKCIVNKYGTKRWYLHGKLHREDGPAVDWPDGSKEWHLHGERHREVGPAFEGVGGRKVWWLNDKLHREDGPAVEDAGGDKEWWLHGKRVHPETIVDLHLIRGIFCYYNEQTGTLHFDENK